jgi:cell wall-associated NlpC family hydrolase
MSDYFDKAERLTALRDEAESWLGTPFRAYACVKGEQGGTDCVRLAYGVLSAIGVIPQGKEFPTYSMDFTLHSKHSPIIDFIDTELTAYFEKLPPETIIKPGDLLGFKIGKAVHHLSIVVDQEVMLQSVKPIGTRLVSLGDTTFMKRLAVIYRAKEIAP